MIRPLILSAMTLILAACSAGNGLESTASERRVPVVLATAVEGPAAPAIRTTAMLAHKDETRLAFKVGGIVARIEVEEGEAVSAGQVLAELELAEVGSQVEQARQLVAKAERDLERGEALHREQVIPLEAVQDLRTQRDIARQNLKAVAFNREHAVIKAPSDGVVLRKLAEARETVAPGSPVLVLGAAGAGWVLKASLADRQIVQLALGDEARVSFDALPSERLRATVSRLPAAADPRTGMFDVELTLTEPDPRLRSGLVARLQLSPASAGAAALVHVPIGAILEGDRERASVYVHDAAAGRVSRRAVRVAFIDGDSVALASGLDVGAEVVVEGASFVSEGALVRVVEAGAGGDE